jgi:uncharacterized surface protein with fasciclin (FAS1) repeats
MKINKYIGMTMMAAGVLAAASCTDFDDYNKEVVDATPAANQTLWENIQQNGNLSEFASLVKKVGFDKALSETHYYTVWAPLNGTFNVAQYQSLTDSALLRQFVKNHIADYAHAANGQDERVLMLNEKSYDFTGTSTFEFGRMPVNQANLPNTNGLLHTLNGALTYYPNLYEQVTDSLLSQGLLIDSLRHYFKAPNHEQTYLDESASVVGPIVNGKQTYVDSVIVTTNTLWGMLNVRMLNEDSSYVALLPTNTAWQKAYDKIKSYFSYHATTQAQTFTNGNVDAKPASVTIDPAYWQDSLASSHLVRNLFFSKNDAYNTWLDGGTPSPYGVDTLRSTTRNKLSNPQGILDQAVMKLELSNGKGFVVDSLAMYPWDTYAPEIRVSAASSNNIGRVVTGSYKTIKVVSADPNQDDFSYIHITPSGGYAKPELNLYLPNVLSTTYDIYCVFVPPVIDKPEEVLPNRVIFTLNYCDASGALKEQVFLDESEENIASFQEKFNLSDNTTNRTTIRAFSNNPEVIDTVYIGEFTFPTCYAGLGSEYRPNIKITSPFSVFNKNLMSTYTRDMHIASIILKPKELVEFEESNKK